MLKNEGKESAALCSGWREGDSLDGMAHVGVGTQSYDNHDDCLRVDVDGGEDANGYLADNQR
jgi:hypothetical protein